MAASLTDACPGADDLMRAIAAVAPRLSVADRQDWQQVLAPSMAKASIVTPRTVAAFLGQCAVESGGFRDLEENLWYSAGRLCQVWPARFPDPALAAPYAGQPQSLADLVYANRLGNGDVGSGDGWRFRGRGLIQITGRDNYTRFAASVGMDLDAAAAFAGTKAGAAATATWFWNTAELTALAASWAIDRITLKINGGLLGAAERSRLCEAALRAIGN
jgi:putative chitinase